MASTFPRLVENIDDCVDNLVRSFLLSSNSLDLGLCTVAGVKLEELFEIPHISLGKYGHVRFADGLSAVISRPLPT